MWCLSEMQSRPNKICILSIREKDEEAPKGEGNSLVAGRKGFKAVSSARQTPTVPLQPAYLVSFVISPPPGPLLQPRSYIFGPCL